MQLEYLLWQADWSALQPSSRDPTSKPYSLGGAWSMRPALLNECMLFIVRSFKAMSVISIMPLAFIALYGANIVLVWTGKSPPLLTGAICLLCVGGVCRSLSSLFRVLYRVSGGALLDNARLFLTIATAVVILPFVPKLGFFGVIAGVGVLGQFFGLVLIAAQFHDPVSRLYTHVYWRRISHSILYRDRRYSRRIGCRRLYHGSLGDERTPS